MYAPPPRRLRTRAIVAILGIVVSMAYTVVSAILPYAHHPIPEALDLTLYAATTLFAGIAFVAWLYRARVNLDALGVPARWRPGWAIGGWFIPLANLIIPLRVVNEVDKATEHRAAAATGRRPSGRATFVFWAVLWTGYQLVGLGLLGDPTPNSPLAAGAAALLVAAGTFAVPLVRRVSARQDAVLSLPPPSMRAFQGPGTPAPGIPGRGPGPPGASIPAQNARAGMQPQLAKRQPPPQPAAPPSRQPRAAPAPSGPAQPNSQPAGAPASSGPARPNSRPADAPGKPVQPEGPPRSRDPHPSDPPAVDPWPDAGY